MTVPSVLLEARSAGSTGAWIDITGWLRIDTPLTITRGREREEATASASTCSLTLDNVGGQFTEGTTSIIGGQSLTWSRWAQLRVSINGELRFTGWLTNLGLTWPGAVINAACVTVTASGVKATLAVSPNLSTWTTELYEDLNPIAWWPLDDPDGSTAGRQLISGQPAMTVAIDDPAGSGRAPYKFGASFPSEIEGGSGLDLSPDIDWGDPVGGDPQLDGWTAALPTATWESPISTPFTVLMIHQPSVLDSGWPVSVDVPILQVSNLPESVRLMRTPSGACYLQRVASGPTFYDQPAGRLEAGVPRMFAVVVTSTTVGVVGYPNPIPYTSGVTALGLGPTAGYVSGSWQTYGIAADGTYSNVAIVPGAMSAATFDELRRRVEGGLGTDLEWLHRACDYAGTASPVKLGPTRQILRPALRGSNPAAIGDQMAEAYGGMLVDGADGTPTLVDPRYVPTQASVPVIDLDAVDGDALRWSSDPTLRVTEAGLGESVMASRNSWPRSRVEIPAGVPTTAAQSRANWLVYASDVAEAPRLTGIKLDLLAMAYTADYEPLAYLQRPRVRVDAASLPGQIAGPLRTMTVEGTTEVVSVSEWSLELSTAPDPRFILADSVQGVLGVPADNRLGY